jgi:hypothetical protein
MVCPPYGRAFPAREVAMTASVAHRRPNGRAGSAVRCGCTTYAAPPYGSRLALVLVQLMTMAFGGIVMAADGDHRISQASRIRVPAVEGWVGKVFTHDKPLGRVTRELYLPYPQPDTSTVINTDYCGHLGLRRYEVLTYQVFDDVYQDAEVRYSEDNGKSWSGWAPCAEVDVHRAGDHSWQFFAPVGPTPGAFDAASGLLVQPYVLVSFGDDPRQIGLSKTNYHLFWRTSADDGRSWSEGRMVKYEAGPDFSPEAIRSPQFMSANQGVYYYNTLPLKGGGVLFPADGMEIPAAATESSGTPPPYFSATWRAAEPATPPLLGLRIFRGAWDAAAGEYRWEASAPITIPRELSGYLAEPWLAELADGRILVDLRGTTVGATDPNASGRHWYALSADQGRTWSEVREWRYDDGEQFYGPATMGKLLRHSITKKLYWIGNISATPPQGNLPRYPLYIAEVDESIPALRRSTLTVIDTYDPARHADPKLHTGVQFSNFFAFENRQTHEIELYLSPYGEYDNVYQASVYRYTVRLK